VKALEAQGAGEHGYAGRESVFGGVTVSGTSVSAVTPLLLDHPEKAVVEITGGAEPATFDDQFPMKKFKLLLDDVIELTLIVILGLSGLRFPTNPLSCNVT